MQHDSKKGIPATPGLSPPPLQWFTQKYLCNGQGMDKGTVLISLKVPWDIVDAELFVKTTKGHFGILMDPWSSTSWRKYWSQQHTPNKITKEKIWCLRQVKAEGKDKSVQDSRTRIDKKINLENSPTPVQP